MSSNVRANGVWRIEGVDGGVALPVEGAVSEQAAFARATATFTLSQNPHDFSEAPTTGGFIVSITGRYKLRLADDTDANFITPYLVAGTHYRLNVAKVWATASPESAEFTGFIA